MRCQLVNGKRMSHNLWPANHLAPLPIITITSHHQFPLTTPPISPIITTISHYQSRLPSYLHSHSLHPFYRTSYFGTFQPPSHALTVELRAARDTLLASLVFLLPLQTTVGCEWLLRELMNGVWVDALLFMEGLHLFIWKKSRVEKRLSGSLVVFSGKAWLCLWKHFEAEAVCSCTKKALVVSCT